MSTSIETSSADGGAAMPSEYRLASDHHELLLAGDLGGCCKDVLELLPLHSADLGKDAPALRLG